MSQAKQVDKPHYEFDRYMSKARWISLWHQLNEIHKLKPDTVLEIGPGPGFFKAMAAQIGITVKTLDLDPELDPDYLGSATSIPLPDSSFDVVCAFQMLEHLPYELALQAFQEMTRVSRSRIVISLPDAKVVWRYRLHIPKMGPLEFLVPSPLFKESVHEFDGEHYWEINKRNYSLSRVISDFSREAELLETFRVTENPYQRFFVFGQL